MRSTAAAPRNRTNRRVLLWGTGLVLLQLIFRAWAVYGGWFQFDDFAFLSRAYNSPLDAAYLTESYAGHLMPAGFLLTWLFARWEPLGWVPYATTLLAMQAIASFAFLRLLTHLFGPRRAILPLLVLYLFSVISLPAFIWWAAGINQLPLQIALFLGLHSHVTYLRTRKVRYAAATIAWTVLGLLFYEKTLLVFLAYGLVAMCYFARGTFEDRVAHLWSTYRPGVVLHGVLFVGYLVPYLLTSINFDPNNANQTPVFPVAYRFVVAFTTGIVGGPWRWQDINPVGRLADPSDITIFLSWLAVGYLVFLAHRTRERSLRAWLLPLSFLAADVLLLTAGRAFLVGAVIGREYRYQTEMPAVFALAVGLAFLPLLGATETVASREASPLPFGPRRAVTALSGLFLVGALFSSVQYAGHWQTKNPAPAYFDNVLTSLDEHPGRTPLANLGVPTYIMWGFRFPENTYSHLLSPWSSETSYPSAATDDLFVFDDQGRITEASVSAMRRNVPSPDQGCGYRVEGPDPVRVPLDAPVIGGGWWVRLGYLADGSGSVTVTAGRRVHDVPVEKGLHAMYFQADGDFEAITLSGLDEGLSLCTDDVTLGIPEPREP